MTVPSRRPGRPKTRTPENSGSRTLLAGIEMLKTVAQLPRPATLSEIGRAANMLPSRAYRYLTTLTQAGLVNYNLRTGYYGLGPAAIDFAILAMSKVDAIQIASEIIRELTDTVHLVSHIGIWGSNGPTVIRWEQGDLPISIRIREGINLSLLTTATGRIFLSYLDERHVAAILRYDIDDWNATAPISKRFTLAKIHALTKAVRANGLACVIGMRNPHVASVSVPVFDRSGLALSLTLSGIEGTFDVSLDGDPVRHLRAAALHVSQRLGGRPGGDEPLS